MDNKSIRRTRYYIGLVLKKFLPNAIKKQFIYSRLSFTKVVSTDIDGRKLFFQCHAEEVSNTVFYTGIFGDYEGQSLKIWHDLIVKLNIKTVMDIGAYSGIYSLTAACANEDTEIHSYEPNPFAFSLLKKNCNLNNMANINLHDYAVAERTGELEFYNFGDTYSTGMTSVNHRYVEENISIGSFKAKDIFAVRKEINKKIELMKLDIERAELPLLNHAKKLLQDDRPIILCEVLDEADYVDYQDLLESLNYGYIQINDDDHTYTECESILNHGKQSVGRNWIFYPKEKQAMIKAVI
jgi:FkbM family methyltransferase